MAFRFRKSVKLAPGIRLSLGKRGLGLNVGRRGASISIGQRGVYSNVGIPGTGISFRQKLSGSSRKRARKVTASTHVVEHNIKIDIDESGAILFKDANGNVLPKRLITLAKQQLGDTIHTLVQKKCEEINKEIESVGEIHFDTEDPKLIPSFEAEEFDEPLPEEPKWKKYGFLSLIFHSLKDKVDLQNDDLKNNYEENRRNWQKNKKIFEDNEKDRKWLVENGIYRNVGDMEIFLESRLNDLQWPRETTVDFEILDEGKIIFIDVDLPEIEDMPNKIAHAIQNGNKVSIKEMSEVQIQKLYMKHVHGIGFRLIGEVFSSLPVSETVVISGYSKRVNKGTGEMRDEYLYSCLE